MILAALAAMMMAMTATVDDAKASEAAIRAQRAASNAAIAAHDLAGMRAVLSPDYTVLPGSSGLPSRLADFDARIGATFGDPAFVTYIRTPERVVVAGSGKRAAESGSWVGVWRKPDGEMRLSGVYQATWMPTAKGWRLLNESFVSLACSGSSACADVY